MLIHAEGRHPVVGRQAGKHRDVGQGCTLTLSICCILFAGKSLELLPDSSWGGLPVDPRQSAADTMAACTQQTQASTLWLTWA